MTQRAFIPLSVKQWLSTKSPKIQHVISGSAHYNKLYTAIYAVTDEKFHSVIFLGPLNGSRLTVYTDRAAYATQLHYALHNQAEEIAKRTGLPIRQFDIKVDPRRLKKASKPLRKPQASKDGASCLATAARSLGDSPVADALARLAVKVEKPGK